MTSENCDKHVGEGQLESNQSSDSTGRCGVHRYLVEVAEGPDCKAENSESDTESRTTVEQYATCHKETSEDCKPFYVKAVLEPALSPAARSLRSPHPTKSATTTLTRFGRREANRLLRAFSAMSGDIAGRSKNSSGARSCLDHAGTLPCNEGSASLQGEMVTPINQ
jgi:hypothetical protein